MLRVQEIKSFRKHEKALTDNLYLVQKRFSPGGLNIGLSSLREILDITKVLDYLQISKVTQSAINDSKADSEARKQFFRKFRKFLTPGLQVRKSRISRVKEFWKFRYFCKYPSFSESPTKGCWRLTAFQKNN